MKPLKIGRLTAEIAEDAEKKGKGKLKEFPFYPLSLWERAGVRGK